MEKYCYRLFLTESCQFVLSSDQQYSEAPKLATCWGPVGIWGPTGAISTHVFFKKLSFKDQVTVIKSTLPGFHDIMWCRHEIVQQIILCSDTTVHQDYTSVHQATPALRMLSRPASSPDLNPTVHLLDALQHNSWRRDLCLPRASSSGRTFSTNVAAPRSWTFRGSLAPWGFKQRWLQQVITNGSNGLLDKYFKLSYRLRNAVVFL